MPVFCQTVLLAQCVIQRLFQRSFVKRSGIPNIIGGARQQCFTWVVGLVVNKTGGAVGVSSFGRFWYLQVRWWFKVYYVCSYNNRNHAKFTPALFLCQKSLAQKNHLHKFACCGRYVAPGVT
jgi:hypothetical protein